MTEVEVMVFPSNAGRPAVILQPNIFFSSQNAALPSEKEIKELIDWFNTHETKIIRIKIDSGIHKRTVDWIEKRGIFTGANGGIVEAQWNKTHDGADTPQFDDNPELYDFWSKKLSPLLLLLD